MTALNRYPGLAALEQELEALEAVHSALETEYNALVDSAADRLEVAVADKNAALATLQVKRANREAMLGRTEVRSNIAQNTQLTPADQTAALALLDAINAAGQACQTRNARNGQLIGGLRDMTEGALSILRGEPMVALYGQSGDRASDLGSRSLGTA